MNIVPIQPEYSLVVRAEDRAWEQFSEDQRQLARQRERFITGILIDIKRDIKIAASIKLLLLRINAEQVEADLNNLALQLGRNGKPPGRATLFRWVDKYQSQGIAGLVDKHNGRQRKVRGWESRAKLYYQMPSKLAMAAIANLLMHEGHADATESRVAHYLKSLPHNERNKKRMGAKAYRAAHHPFKVRDTSVLMPGSHYQGDGHTIDVRLAHPLTGKPWRPELTVWLDVYSRFVVGWYISLSESSLSTLFSLSRALLTHDHVPGKLHIDNGSGFRAKMMNDESIGFYDRFHMQTMFSIPGNPQGKGNIERFFRTIRDGYDKTFESYCGHDMSGEVSRKLLIDVRCNKKQLPTLDTYTAGLANFFNAYHNRVHSSLNGQTPAQMWATLQRVPVITPAEAVVRPRITHKVRNSSLTFFKRRYIHAELQNYNGKQLLIEYNLFDSATVRVLTDDGRFICDATLQARTPYDSASRIEDMQKHREQGRLKRHENHAIEIRERERMNINHEAYVAKLGIIDEIPLQLPRTEFNLLDQLNDAPDDAADDVDLDITDTDY